MHGFVRSVSYMPTETKFSEGDRVYYIDPKYGVDRDFPGTIVGVGSSVFSVKWDGIEPFPGAYPPNRLQEIK